MRRGIFLEWKARVLLEHVGALLALRGLVGWRRIELGWVDEF